MAKSKWEAKYSELRNAIDCEKKTLMAEYDKAGEHYKKAKEAGDKEKMTYWVQYRKGLKKGIIACQHLFESDE